MWGTGASEKRMLATVNRTPLSRSEMLRLGEEVTSLERGDRDFEGHLLAVLRAFGADEHKAMSAMFRVVALYRLIADAPILGWTGERGPDGGTPALAELFVAAGRQPLIERDGQFTFDRDALLRAAFLAAGKSTAKS